MKKKLKVLFLGNSDNVNLKLCMWSRNIGVDAFLWRMDEGGRGNPMEYAPDLFEHGNPDWVIGAEKSNKQLIISTLIKSRDIDYINKNFDVVIISGKRALIFSLKIKLPKLLVPVGYEVCYLLDKTSILKTLKRILYHPKFVFEIYLNFVSLIALKSLNGIFDSFEHNFRIYKHFNLEKILYPKSIGEDCEKVRKLVDKKTIQALEKETAKAKKVFLWFSRLNYRNLSSPNYKGVDLFLKALEDILPLLENGEVLVYIGKHGIDTEPFIELAKKSPVYHYIRWREHLEYPKLLSYLSLKNAILFTDFGKNNSGVSGIGRDALVLGTVTINSCTDKATTLQYGKPAPKNYASTPKEITEQIYRLLGMSDEKFRNCQNRNKQYSDTHMDYKNYLKWFYQDVEKVINSAL